MAGRGGALGFNPRLIRYYLPQTFSETTFNGGICRDVPPTSIPAGFLYDDVDFNLEQPGLSYYRGPIKTFGEPLGGTLQDGPEPAWISTQEQNGVTKVLVQWNDHLWEVPESGPAIDRGAMSTYPQDRPKVFPNNGVDILVFPSQDGVAPPLKIVLTGGVPVPSQLGGNPPPGTLVAVHQNWLVLAAPKANPNRVYFMPSTGAEDDWTTFPSFIDTTYPITALASVQGVLLVFSHSFCERIIGDTPPNNPGENMTLQALGATGCMAPRTIQPWGANILFANQKGVYVTNGAGFDSLTEKVNGTGISSLWADLTPGLYQPSIVAGLFNQQFYVVSLGAGGYNLVCYLPQKAWWRFSSLSFQWTDSSADILGQDELYHVGNRYTGMNNQVYTCSAMFEKEGNTQDDAVPAGIEKPGMITRMIGDGLGLKAYEHGHITFSSPGGIALGYYKGAGLESRLAGAQPVIFPESPFDSNTSYGTKRVQRQRFKVNIDAQAIYLIMGKGGPTTIPSLRDTYILSAEVEVRDATYGATAEAVYP